MVNEEKEQKDLEKAKEIVNTLQAPGWKHIWDILCNMYAQSLDNLVEKESPNDRARLLAIEDMCEGIDKTLKIGDFINKKRMGKLNGGK